jgi:hypothetical protein
MRMIWLPGIAAVLILLLTPGPICAQSQQTASCAQVAPVCAVKSGTRQSYWNACQASRDGAFVLLAGECPASPNSDGGGGGGGGGGM